MGFIKDIIRVKANVKGLNNQISHDVFGNRFKMKIAKISRAEGLTYFLMKLIDNEDHSRDKICHGWYTANEIVMFHRLYRDMNDFIVSSDFWVKRKNKIS